MDHRDEFDNWCNLWDKALSDGVFPSDEPKPQAQLPSHLPQDDVESDPYYDYLNADYDGLLQESKTTANPIYPDSVGKDQEPTNPWVRNDLLEKVIELKKRLYDIECKFNSASGGGKQWNEKAISSLKEDKKLISQLTSLRKQIDELSDNLGVKDEPKGSMRKIEG